VVSWTVPEEFRVWKERVDALEKKKQDQEASVAKTTAQAAAATSATTTAEGESGASRDGSAHPRAASSAAQARDDDAAAQVPVYATREEAIEAFKAMLEACDVSAAMKMKEVVDLCQDDPRFNALKTAGEKKQALAEYQVTVWPFFSCIFASLTCFLDMIISPHPFQTKRLKQEKETQKNKARKNRDAFLLMLAENTAIDAHTRWREAIDILQNDVRYKNVEDPNDREELFKDFVQELEKKEREDRMRSKKTALQLLEAVFDAMKTAGSITRRSSWVDSKREVQEKVAGPEFRALEELDVKRSFQNYVERLDTRHREEERQRRDELQRKMNAVSAEFKVHLEALVASGVLNHEARWKDWQQRPELQNSEAFKNLEALVHGDGSTSAGIVGGARDVFDKVIAGVRETHRLDKRLVRDVFSSANFIVRHDTALEDARAALSAAAGLSAQSGAVKPASSNPPKGGEDGEEVDDAAVGGLSGNAKQVRVMLTKRPMAFDFVFADLLEQAKADYEDEQRKQRKREERYVQLLEEYYYRSDHVGVPWDDAKVVLGKHSSYDALEKVDRKRLFDAYMEQVSTAPRPVSVAPLPKKYRRRHIPVPSHSFFTVVACTQNGGENKSDAEPHEHCSQYCPCL
jgi:hypothetical protein